MNDVQVSNGKKHIKTQVLTDLEIKEMERKLLDETYVYGAIYRLASILTEQILNSGGLDDEQE